MVLAEIARLCDTARQAIAQRDWEKAKQVYLQALGLKSDQPDVHYGLATVYFQLRELTSAAHHFREVTRLDPRRAGAWVNLGAVLNLLEQYDEALAALRKGISIDNKRVEGYYNMGLVYRRKGQTDLAIQSYREALRLNPRMADACLNLANIYSKKEQHRLALEFYKQALQMRPTWDKAIEGLERTEAAMNPAAAPAAAPPDEGKSEADPDRMIDPAVHGNFLNTLHSATIESEDTGRLFEALLQQEVEPAIKDLSSCLLYPEGARSELDACIRQFEAALEHMRSVHRTLQAKIERVRTLGEQFQ